MTTLSHGRMGHIFIGVAAGFPSRSTLSAGHFQAALSADLGVATRGRPPTLNSLYIHIFSNLIFLENEHISDYSESFWTEATSRRRWTFR